MVTGAATELQCIFCENSGHIINKCNRFKKLSPSDRYAHVKKLSACLNCLKVGHFITKCSQSKCGICSQNHHSLLHMGEVNNYESPEPSTSSHATHHVSSNGSGLVSNGSATSCSITTLPVKTSTGESKNNYVFLATAMTIACNKWGHTLPCRVLLDSASQLNFITERLANQLHLHREPSKIDLTGVGGIETSTRHMTFLTINSRINNFSLPIEVYILPQITGQQPDRFIDVSRIGMPSTMVYADPKFNSPQKIDLLIGTEHFFSLLSIGQFSTTGNEIVFQNTVFGWVVTGKTTSNTSNKNSFSCCVATHALVPLDKQVQQFWELEEAVRGPPRLSEEDAECVQHYNQSVSRAKDGRYIVRLPFRRSPNVLGKSQLTATQRFFIW